MLNQKGNGLIIGILIGLLVAAGLFGAYYFGMKANNVPTPVVYNQTTVNPTTQPSTSATALDSTADWKTLSRDGYTIKYPNNWAVDKNAAEGCGGPVIKPQDNSLNGWITFCGSGGNNTTPDDEVAVTEKANNVTHAGTTISKTPFTADGQTGVKFEWQQDANQSEIDAYIGKIYVTTNLPNGQTQQQYGPAAIYLYEKDNLHQSDARILFDQMLSTIQFTK